MGFRWKLIPAFAALFLIGGLCGSLITYRVAAGLRPARVPARTMAARLYERLGREVRLTPDQIARYRPQIDQAIQKMKETRRQAVSDSDLELDAALARIGAELPSDGQLRMERFRARRRQGFLNWMARQAPP
ncbi:MAG TPA: hypothetical protein VGD78_10220 [Chthoniobacterales bacterium]